MNEYCESSWNTEDLNKKQNQTKKIYDEKVQYQKLYSPGKSFSILLTIDQARKMNWSISASFPSAWQNSCFGVGITTSTGSLLQFSLM